MAAAALLLRLRMSVVMIIDQNLQTATQYSHSPHATHPSEAIHGFYPRLSPPFRVVPISLIASFPHTLPHHSHIIPPLYALLLRQEIDRHALSAAGPRSRVSAAEIAGSWT